MSESSTQSGVAQLTVPSPKRTTFAPEVADPSKPVRKSEEVRRKFGNNVEAVISVIANAVGLGNVWRFPYMCYRNGGGAFFVPYVIMLVVAGMPIMGMEMSWGQFTSLGPIASWNCYPLLGGVGLSALMICWLIVIYYAILTAYALFYIGASLYSLKDMNDPVWNGCDNHWNTINCKTIPQLRNLTNSNVSLPHSAYAMPSAEFWYNFVSHDEGDIRNFGYPNYMMVISLFLSYCIVLASIWRGVRSIGKAMYFFAIFPYFCIIFLCFGGFFKEGAAEGILVYLIPKWEKLLELQVWADAGQQIFFTLSLSQGVILCLSSFNDFHQHSLTNTLIVVVVNCCTSFWVGFPIFAVLGHMAYQRQVPVDEVVSIGPGLAFIAYPQALSLLPGAAIWAIFFCSMLFSVGMGSLATLAEAVIAQVIDFYPTLRARKKEIALRVCFILSWFLLGLPMICTSGGMQLLDIVDGFCTGVNSYIIALIMLIVICGFYGTKNYERDLQMMTGMRPNLYWRITWQYLAPAFLGFSAGIWIFNKTGKIDDKPYWYHNLGWTITISTLVVIPIYAVYKMLRDGNCGGCKAYKALTKPNKEWGPAEKEDRIGFYYRESEHVEEVDEAAIFESRNNNMDVPNVGL